ncbi:polysaccharide deacetylase [Micromonospora sp. DR5-3]|uniref:polysaccharide deacetylase family protein n=1 Tax=unclassified Micromonospora TaxID=2617518 RepID=UPI0011D94C06|nr:MULTISPECIES: polysaccharide deacetylase [unclassified Micromonospora]MCW3818968.1 polysaccharide deacetylase [Micromonospora sp. DR5-3]TYC19647.1 polysaccharide deacetylase [Micromonospora sp. MP36]
MSDLTTDQARWPGGARVAVVVTVDLDADLAILAASPSATDRAKTLSVGGYGAWRGADRLLDLFAERDVPSTWFVPGRNALRYPDLVRRIAAAGHELACHGDAHEDFNELTLAGQVAAVRAGLTRLRETAGVPVRGFRTPMGEWAPGLAAHLHDLGISWSSSSHGDDLPFLHPGLPAAHDHARGPGAESHGGLVEIPVHYELEDHQYFFFNLEPAFPVGQSRIAPYAEVLANWKQEFDAYHRFGLCFVLRLHPEVTGTPGRVPLVRELLTHIQAQPDVWLTTGSELADWWSQHHRINEPGHPADVFARLNQEARA